MEFIARGVEPALWKFHSDRMRPYWGGTQQTEGKRRLPTRPFGPMAIRKRFDRLFKNGRPMPRYALEGLGQERILDALRAGMKAQGKLIARKQRAIEAALGNGLGHVRGWWESLKTGLPREHYHANLAKHSVADLALVKKVQGLSQYEIEHMAQATLDKLVARVKATQKPVTQVKFTPLDSPEKAANDALRESAGGSLLLSIEKLMKYLPYILVGGAALVGASFVIPRARRLVR